MRQSGLSRATVVEGAVRVADRDGLAAVSMRNVGKELGVEAMSLYHHVKNKDDLLDELADWIFAGIELPAIDRPWRAGMADRAASARRVLAKHPWGLGLMESRSNPGPALLRHHDTVLGCLRRGGFSVAMAAHAFSVIDAYVYGFVLTELNLPFQSGGGEEASFAAEVPLPADEYPHLAEMVHALVLTQQYSFAEEFDYGLQLILDELERRLG